MRIDVFLLSDNNYIGMLKYIKNNLSLLFVFTLLYFITRYFHYLSKKKYFLLIKIFFIVGTMQTLSYYIPLLNIFNEFIGLFMNRGDSVHNIMVGRGVIFLCPEPSFAGMLFIIMLIINIYYYKVINLITKKEFFKYSMLLIISIILTKSATSYLLLLILTLIYLLIYSKRNFIFMIGISIIISYVILQNGISNRGIKVIDILINNPTILLHDRSVTARLSDLLVGIGSLTSYPFGHGSGTGNIYYFNENNFLLFQYISTNFNVSLEHNSVVFQSLLGNLLFTYGFIGLFPVYFIVSIFLFKPILKKDYIMLKFSMLMIPLILFMILTSNPISFPYIWLLFGISLNYFYIQRNRGVYNYEKNTNIYR